MRSYQTGEAIYREGDPSHSIFGLVSGRWLVKVPPADTMITVAKPGFWIGEAGIFRGAERAASVTAVTAATVLYLPPSEFAALTRDSENCLHFAANTAEALAEAIAVIGNLSQPNAAIRVAQRLITLCNFQFGTHEHVIQLSQSDLGELCNLSRASLSTVLQGFVTDGLIALEYRKLVVLDMARLAELAFDDDRMWR